MLRQRRGLRWGPLRRRLDLDLSVGEIDVGVVADVAAGVDYGVVGVETRRERRRFHRRT